LPSAGFTRYNEVVGTDPISEFFDREACCRVNRSRDAKRPYGATKALIEGLEAAGLGDRSVLELGCGTGFLSTELLSHRASHVTGIDLSEKSVGMARERAESAGLAERSAFLVGDAANDELERHDVVVLDKVFCCYPDYSSLIGNSLPAAGSVYAFSLPASNGVRGLISRLVIGIENAWRRMTGDPFRAFVHDVGKIEGLVRAAGFKRIGPSRKLLWAIFVFTR
jgi:SAM-dependent methyltransferase